MGTKICKKSGKSGKSESREERITIITESGAQKLSKNDRGIFVISYNQLPLTLVNGIKRKNARL